VPSKSPPEVELTGKQRSYLRALAHTLKPVVQIGQQGVTEGLIDAIDAALERHELVKVKLLGETELEADETALAIAQRTRSHVAQTIGRTLVIYRRREREPKIVLPAKRKSK
jgi:RNA-binding protein